jgi:hypothetical protein
MHDPIVLFSTRWARMPVSPSIMRRSPGKSLCSCKKRKLDLGTAKVLVEDTRGGQLEGNRLFEKWYQWGLKKIKIDGILSQPCVSY